MATFSVTLHQIGDRVRVRDMAVEGTVVAWQKIEGTIADVVHVVRLDTPIDVPPKVQGSTVLEPAHRIEFVDRPCSGLDAR